MKKRAFLSLGAAAAAISLGAAQDSVDDFSTHDPAARAEGDRIVTPVNQIVEPAGRQVYLPKLRPQALALSPDGRILVTSGKTHDLIVIDPVSAQVLQQVRLPSEDASVTNTAPASAHMLFKEDEGQLSFTGLIFSPDGSRIFLSNVSGSMKVFGVDALHHVHALYSIPLPPANAPRRKEEIPTGLAFSRDGRRLYVALNLSNRVAELDAATGAVLRIWDVGVAPYDVVVAGDRIYVSNWGGRRPDADSVTGPAGRGTVVRVDAHGVASEGSVTVIDARADKVLREILTGKHTCALALSPKGRYLVAANADSDTLSVIDTRSNVVVETICARQDPGDLFGASPNALAFDKNGKRLFVCNGTQNAVAVIDFKPGDSKLRGLIPGGWFPGAITCDPARHTLCVANIKGMGNGRARQSNGSTEFNSHQYYGGISLVTEPDKKELQDYTRRALAGMRYPLLKLAALPARPGQPARPVPERVGEPSVFKHVVYLIKENRTYDQVLGDVQAGNGDPELCVFGQQITPNQHKFTRDFVLLDNTYCSGILSADGHEWATTAFATDYMEKLFAGFPRSYPDGCEDDEVDALAYSPQGFIWDDCLAHGKTVRDYGEFTITRKKWRDKARAGKPKFLDAYNQFINGTAAIEMHSDPGVETLRPYFVTNYIGWDMDVPDVQRAATFIAELKAFETNGDFPNLVIIGLPNDHTSGTDPGSPTPAAQVADNDLAFGQIVDALSHSRFWPQTCIVGIEDDPQSGWDHVSGYRTTAYVISPYTKRGTVVGTQYNQTSLLRTMELILGLPPMNQMDATATSMSDCFTNQPDLTPYVALTNNVALDKMNPEPKKISDAVLRKDAYASARLPLEKADQCPEDLLNRIIWHATKGPQVPYPAWATPGRDDD
ncbi:MAG TPA: bifunctional YncE family protein/alkaline phosphatase family protein [Candidatus Baltobacteraceae bacterium]|jgi:YVTN family beta-propeller protein|nr:bifunctional YncE family protein/alkaline phosphatase family protein [Candidatus Baltobacteraceae bacterium]